jgi:hypothetical protein
MVSSGESAAPGRFADTSVRIYQGSRRGTTGGRGSAWPGGAGEQPKGRALDGARPRPDRARQAPGGRYATAFFAAVSNSSGEISIVELR